MRKQRMKFALILVIVVVLVFVGTAAFFIVQGQRQKATYEAIVAERDMVISNNTKIVYFPVGTIEVGEIVTEEKVQRRSTVSGISAEYFITEEDLGSVASVTMDSNTPIMKNMIAPREELTEGLYEIECDYFYLNTNLQENDTVDIRISFPNGEDYVVVAKKNLKDLTLTANNVFLWLNEDEILTLSSAIVDAATHSGTKLYTAKYVSPLLQEASAVTYSPNPSVIEIIQNNPNIVEESAAILSEQARRDLDERLSAYVVELEEGEEQGIPSEIITVEPNEELVNQTTTESAGSLVPTPTPIPVGGAYE